MLESASLAVKHCRARGLKAPEALYLGCESICKSVIWWLSHEPINRRKSKCNQDRPYVAHGNPDQVSLLGESWHRCGFRCSGGKAAGKNNFKPARRWSHGTLRRN